MYCAAAEDSVVVVDTGDAGLVVDGTAAADGAAADGIRDGLAGKGRKEIGGRLGDVLMGRQERGCRRAVTKWSVLIWLVWLMDALTGGSSFSGCCCWRGGSGGGAVDMAGWFLASADSCLAFKSLQPPLRGRGDKADTTHLRTTPL